MGIEANDVRAVSVGELLHKDLRIPSYQRPYSWRPETALQLLDDITEVFNGRDHQSTSYVLGAVILHAVLEDSSRSDGSRPSDSKGRRLDVVDGKQRLLTLRMILASLNSEGVAPTPTKADNPISNVRLELHRNLAGKQTTRRLELARFIRERCHVVQIVTDDVDEAFRVFDSKSALSRGGAIHPAHPGRLK